MYCNSIGGTASLTVDITDDQKIPETHHTKIAVGNVEIRKFLHRRVIGITKSLKSVTHENARTLVEVFPIKQLGMIFDEYVCETAHVAFKPYRQGLGVSEACVD